MRPAGVSCAVFAWKTARMKSDPLTILDHHFPPFSQRFPQFSRQRALGMAGWTDISCGVAQLGSGYPKCLVHVCSCVMSLSCRSGPSTIGSSQCSYFDYQSPCMALSKIIRMEQYAATMGSWFGLNSSEIGSALPNLSNFNASDLGFMNGTGA